MSIHQATLRIYQARAKDYAQLARSTEERLGFEEFVSALPDAARVLDLGCGPGIEAQALAKVGHFVDAWDASPEMIAQIPDHPRITTQICDIITLNTAHHYNGIMANFSLLHLPKAEFPTMLKKISKALCAGGIVQIGLKLGIGEKVDSLGRFYSYFSQDELRTHLKTAGLVLGTCWEFDSAGLDKSMTPAIVAHAHV